MSTVKSTWESTEINPNENQLKKMWENRIAELENIYSREKQDIPRREKELEPLIKSSGLSPSHIKDFSNDNRENSKKFFLEADKQFSKPAMNIEEMHDADLRLMKMNAERMTLQGPNHWQGIIFKSSYGGWHSAWNGEAEEIPNVKININQNRIDPRTQAWGEGLFDSDFSQTSAYLGFQFSPPSWGQLHVYVGQWVHGYYRLYSNDTWYNQEYASARLQTWVDLHQHFWRDKQAIQQFHLAGDELHPERAGRIDRHCMHNYYTQVGENDTVTIRVGVDLHCRGRANGGRARLDFQGGDANYVYVPYIYWYLNH